MPSLLARYNAWAMMTINQPPISPKRAMREFFGILSAYAAFYIAVIILIELHAI
jgi:hypothetical protein